MLTKYRDTVLEVKALADDGTFTGYGSVFGVVDTYDEIVAPGAFAASLKAHAAKKSMPALLWQHRADEPIGVYTDVREDEHGLLVEGRLALKTTRGGEAYELLKMGAVTGLSIGFVPRKRELDDDSGVITLTEVDLWETSLVTFPANDAARISAVKQFGAGETPDLRTLERALRESLGMSKRHAKALLSGGYEEIARRDADDEDLSPLLDEVNAAIRSFKSGA